MCDDCTDPGLRHALNYVRGLEANRLTILPVAPTPAMLRAGARAGKLPESAVDLVWRAMLKAAE